jgi:hypothetical protein
MTNHERSDEPSDLNQLRNLSRNIFSENADLYEIMGDRSNFEEHTVAVISGIAIYGDSPNDQCEVEITNFVDVDSGECFIYLIDDSCFYLNNSGLFNIENKEDKLDDCDVIGLKDLIEDATWMPMEITEFYGKHTDN